MSAPTKYNSKNICNLKKFGAIKHCSLEQISNSHSMVIDLVNTVTNIKSGGQSAVIIREAIQSAFGEEQQPIHHFTCAKDAGLFLEEHGYTREYSKKIKECVPGDIMILEPIRDHKNGHIQIMVNNGTWVSDFIQKSPFPWDDAKDSDQYTVYSREI